MVRVSLENYTAGDYDPGSLIKRVIWLVVSRLFFETSFPWASSFQSAVLRGFGAKVGKGVVFKPGVKIKYPWFLEVGDHCWIGEHAWVDNLATVELGESVVVSQGAYLLTGNHDYKSPDFDLMVSPITLGDCVWIAANATVCPGVKAGDLALLSVGSVASSDLEAGWIYRGSPAEKAKQREIRDISE